MEPIQNNSGIGATDNGKTVALVSYLTIVGWAIAFVLNSSQKTALGAFHLRQSLFLYLLFVVIYVCSFFFLFIPFLGWLINLGLMLCAIGNFILWVMGIVNAINGEQKPLPIVGATAQNLFRGLGL